MSETAAGKSVVRERPVIAIDGPAGAGKSTLAAHLARKFGFLNLETGAMYRALALKAIERDLPFEDEAALMDQAEYTRIVLEPQAEGNRVLLDGVDVSRTGAGRGRDGGGVEGLGSSGAAGVDGGAAAEAGGARRRGDGGPRHWDGCFSGCRGEDLSGCGAGGAGQQTVSGSGPRNRQKLPKSQF